VFAGQRDLERAAERLASRLPGPLGGLARLAYNYHWCWQPGGTGLFRDIDLDRWVRVAGNPVRLLEEASPDLVAGAAADPAFVASIARAQERLAADLARPTVAGPLTPERPGAFFCAEFGVHVSLPIYSGGLGALAGDLLKQASDDALALVGVGLLYRQGYFRQRIDGDGRQQEYWSDTDPERIPAALVTGADGEPITVTVPIGEEDVIAQVWRVDVGRVPLYLLDTDRSENSRTARWIASRLYVSDPDVRLAQYLLLGVGGMRALRAMGIDPALLHLNEGHAAFAALELAHQQAGERAPLDGALDRAAARILFTTHTPVPAGNDTYTMDALAGAAGRYAEQIGVASERLARLGRAPDGGDGAPFGLTEFAIHTSAQRNGVSRRHGEVARSMWRGLWPALRDEEVPIGYVTNGVHHPTWIGPSMRALLDRHLGEDWLGRAAERATWEPVQRIGDAELWAARREQRVRLIAAVRERSVRERLGRGEPLAYARAAAEAFDPDVLTIGFARRLATYKRLGLLVADLDGAQELLAGPRPVQIVLAGKAHPRDADGKHMLEQLFELRGLEGVGERVVFLEDYDLYSASLLVQGCDVWMNLPRPPLEASGTSGMKAAVNGGLHLSVLDGWWAEAYDGSNGWSLDGEVAADPEAQDLRDGARLRALLTEEVVPLFYERDADGQAHPWLERVRHSLSTLGPAFSAQRMLRDYVELEYVAAAGGALPAPPRAG
jgi:starch phosphorylase